VQIGVSVVAVVVKTERLALAVFVTLCQCREMDVKEEQRVAIKCCCKVDFSATKTVELIQKPYGHAALSQKTIFEWHKRFREGRDSGKDDESSGRPTTSRTDDNIAAVDKMVKEDRKVTSRLIADTLGILKTVVLRILREDSKKRKLCSRFGSNNWTISDSKTSRNIEPPLPPYSPGLSPPNYFLLPKVKLQLKGARFDTTERIHKAVSDQLNKISAEDFSNAMKKLETRANLCITSNGS
jgi:hypothetical protein